MEEKNRKNQTGLFVVLLIILVRGYRLFLSPLLPCTCRYEPSCSYYAIEALRTHGALRGIGISLMRILRCRPFGDSGYDPVPEVLKERME